MYIVLICYIYVYACASAVLRARACACPCAPAGHCHRVRRSAKGLRKRISPMCTLSQNGYGALISEEPSSSVVVGPKAGLARRARNLMWLRANAEPRD